MRASAARRKAARVAKRERDGDGEIGAGGIARQGRARRRRGQGARPTAATKRAKRVQAPRAAGKRRLGRERVVDRQDRGAARRGDQARDRIVRVDIHQASSRRRGRRRQPGGGRRRAGDGRDSAAPRKSPRPSPCMAGPRRCQPARSAFAAGAQIRDRAGRDRQRAALQEVDIGNDRRIERADESGSRRLVRFAVRAERPSRSRSWSVHAAGRQAGPIGSNDL